MMLIDLLTVFILLGGRTEGQNGLKRNECDTAPEGAFVKDLYACEKFYQCRNGTGISVSCPKGMFFDPYAKICEINDKVYCVPEPMPTEPTAEEIICPEQDHSDVVFVASSFDCHRYFICYHGSAIQQDCITELHWNQHLNKCDFPENSKCKIKETPKCQPNGVQILPHPTECGYFIYCINGFPSVQQCPFYHHWDIVSRKCVWKNLARCFK